MPNVVYKLTPVWLSSWREVVTFYRLAFEDHCELCNAVQRRHGITGEAGTEPLDSGSREDRNAVGWLGTRYKVKGPSTESGTISRRYSSVAAPSEHAHDVR